MPDIRPRGGAPSAYGVTIIGGGPAGLTSAVYAVRLRIDTLIAPDDVGGQASRAWHRTSTRSELFASRLTAARRPAAITRLLPAGSIAPRPIAGKTSSFRARP